MSANEADPGLQNGVLRRQEREQSRLDVRSAGYPRYHPLFLAGFLAVEFDPSWLDGVTGSWKSDLLAELLKQMRRLSCVARRDQRRWKGELEDVPGVRLWCVDQQD